MRGAERPAKVKWTPPFLAPLQPLSASAALETFIEVAEDKHAEEKVEQLLELTGHMPLAVSLMASVAAHEGCDKAWSRWQTESTHMLSDGYDKRSSLDISIMLSFTSSRMTTGAQDLLSVLAILPDGLSDVELVKSNLPIPNILASKAILLQTSLAFIDPDHRLKALVPIREHTLSIHPPNNALKMKLRQHFHGLLELWNQFQSLNPVKIIPQINKNLGNFNSTLGDALQTECSDVLNNFQAILFLNHFYVRIHGTYSRLIPILSAQISRWHSHPIFGDYLVECFESSFSMLLPDAETQVTFGNEYFSDKSPLQQGRPYTPIFIVFKTHSS
jgi:hypothetical protein